MTVKRNQKSSPRKPEPAPDRVIRLTFRVRYHTNFGQSLFLTGNHELLGSDAVERAVPLQYFNDEFWQATINLTVGREPAGAITYHYFVRETDGSLTPDWGADKVIVPASLTRDEVLIIDSWNYAGFPENVFYTKPFPGVLLPREHTRLKTTAPGTVTHLFKIKAPLLAANETICLVGDGAALRNWNAGDPVLLDKVPGQNFFTAPLDLTQTSFPLAYRYGVYDATAFKLVQLEAGQPRILQDSVAPGKQTIVNDGFAILPADTWKGAGVAIPFFSLRSEDSFGVGEFADLRLLADWARQAGLKLIQLLPVNDTTATHTWTDSNPYAAISAFALHPLYLNLARVTAKANLRWLKKLEPERQRLNALDAVDYEAVVKAKLAFLKKIFPSQKAATFASKDYREFFAQNKHWLAPYAAFCHLRDKYGTADFNQWPKHRNCRPKEVAALDSPRSAAREDIALQYFIQYHLHCQLQEAADYAHSQGLALKGDLPIGISRHSADAWQNPELFHLDVQAGAPPDALAAKGQNWGFPTCNWPRMQETNFAWWQQRCEQMSHYFDAFRLDHIAGLFRIWSKQEAMQKLAALKQFTNMLVCGEDLGMVPDWVPEVTRQLGVLSLEIQRLPKAPGKEFSYPREAPYLSVVTPSTHDLSTIRGWWEEEDKARIRKFYQTELDQPGEPPAGCEAWINRAIVIQHLESPAMWSIFQLQDLLGMDEKLRRRNPRDERINIPSNPKNHWRYRMHLTLEKLIRAKEFTGELREYVAESGRTPKR